MDKLPPELLSKILLYLPPMDRLESSLTCRRWAEAMTSSQLLHDVWLDIYGNEMEAACSVLINTQRQYTRLVLTEVNLTKFDFAFWGKIGKNLRVLELSSRSRSADVFFAILQQCSELESLKIVDKYEVTRIEDFVPPRGVCLKQLRDSLRHLRHLHLSMYLTLDILDPLLGLMSNVTSIHLSCHSLKDSEYFERLPSVLEKNGITRTEIDFRYIWKRFTSEDFIKFVNVTFSTLRELRIIAGHLTGAALDTIASCTQLRTLTLSELSSSFNSSDLEKLISNLPPDLEIFELHGYLFFEIEDMVHLVKFKKLRTFGLRCLRGNRILNEFPFSFEEMSTVVNLDLQGFNVDSRVIRGLGCLKNLRTLSLSACPDSECFEAICKNCGRLSALHLGAVTYLTDADGSKLCGFKDLRTLSFSDGVGFTDAIFERGIGSPAMRHLRIVGCPLTDVGLMSIASYHNRLRTVELQKCRNITDVGIVALLQKEPLLKRLEAVDCGLGKHEGSRALMKFYPRLYFYDFQYYDSSDHNDSDTS